MPRGIYIGNKGKVLSEATKQKIALHSTLYPRKPWLGKKLSEKHKRKISLGVLTNPNVVNSWFKKGDKGHLGYKHSKLSREKMSSIRIGRFGGENHWNWRGGITQYSPEFNSRLKAKIKTRDNYECRSCHTYTNLAIHHIDYNKMNCKETNLITLCRRCNARANYNRSKWQTLYKRKMQGVSLLRH